MINIYIYLIFSSFFSRCEIYAADPIRAAHIINPDAQTEEKHEKSPACMPSLSAGWTKSLCYLPPSFSQGSIYKHIGGKTEKHRVAGYNMFKCNKVQQVLVRNENSTFEIKSVVGASFGRDRYRVSVKTSTDGNVLHGTCNCKAGAQGRCKHVGATLYQLNDYKESNMASIPEELACTERPRQWGVKKQKQGTNTQCFDSLVFVKHIPGALPKSIENTRKRQLYSALPASQFHLGDDIVRELATNLQPYRTMWSDILFDVSILFICMKFYP